MRTASSSSPIASLLLLATLIATATTTAGTTLTCPATQPPPAYNPFMPLSNVSFCWSAYTKARVSLCRCMRMPTTGPTCFMDDPPATLSCEEAAQCLRRYFYFDNAQCVEQRAGQMVASTQLVDACTDTLCRLTWNSTFLQGTCGLGSTVGAAAICSRASLNASLTKLATLSTAYQLNFSYGINGSSSLTAVGPSAFADAIFVAPLITAIESDITRLTFTTFVPRVVSIAATGPTSFTVVVAAWGQFAYVRSWVGSWTSGTAFANASSYLNATARLQSPVAIPYTGGARTAWPAVVPSVAADATSATSAAVFLSVNQSQCRTFDMMCGCFGLRGSWPSCAVNLTNTSCGEVAKCLAERYSTLASSIDSLWWYAPCAAATSVTYGVLSAWVPSGEFDGSAAQQRCFADVHRLLSWSPMLLSCPTYGGAMAPVVCNRMSLEASVYYAVSDATYSAIVEFANLPVSLLLANSPAKVAAGVKAFTAAVAPLTLLNDTTQVRVTTYSFNNWTGDTHTLRVSFSLFGPVRSGDLTVGLRRLMSSPAFSAGLLGVLPWRAGVAAPTRVSSSIFLVAVSSPTGNVKPSGEEVSWDCFSAPIAYWSAVEGPYLIALLLLCLYALNMLLVLTRLYHSRDVPGFHVSLQLLSAFAHLAYLALNFPQVFTATSSFSNISICYSTKTADPFEIDPISDNCRSAGHSFSPVSIASAWVTWWISQLFLLQLMSFRGAHRIRDSSTFSFRVAQVCVMACLDVFPLVLSPGFIALETRPWYGHCVQSPLALYDLPIGAISMALVLFAFGACMHDLDKDPTTDTALSAFALVPFIVLGLGFTLVRMATMQSAGWATYCVGTLLPVFISAFHHLLFAVIARRTLWSPNPLENQEPHGIDLMTDELKPPVIALNSLLGHNYLALVGDDDTADDGVDPDPTTVLGCLSHLESASLRTELRVYRTATTIAAFFSHDLERCMRLLTDGRVNVAGGVALGLTPAQIAVVTMYCNDSVGLAECVDTLLAGARFEGATAPWIDYHWNKQYGRSSAACFISVLLRGMAKLPVRRRGGWGVRAMQLPAELVAQYTTVGQRVAWSRPVRVALNARAPLLPTTRNVVVNVPSAACRDASMLFTEVTPVGSTVFKDLTPTWMVMPDTVFTVAHAVKNRAGVDVVTLRLATDM